MSEAREVDRDYTFARRAKPPRRKRSEAHFIRTFKATFGETPHRYLQRAGSSGRCLFCGRATGASPTCAWRSGSRPRHLQPHLPRGRGRDALAVPRPRAAARRAVVLREGVGDDRAVSEKPPDRVVPTISSMLQSISRSQLFVLDQDEALDFYVNTLGLEVAADQDLGFMRWLTVRVPGDPARRSCSSARCAGHGRATTAQVRELLAKGAVGGSLFFTTEDAQHDVRGAEGPRRRHDRRTDDPALRDRLRGPRPLRQRDPHRPDVRLRPWQPRPGYERRGPRRWGERSSPDVGAWRRDGARGGARTRHDARSRRRTPRRSTP